MRVGKACLGIMRACTSRPLRKNMRSIPGLWAINLVVLLSSALSAGSWQEFRIGGPPDEDGHHPVLFSPDVCKSTVVWYSRASSVTGPRKVWAADISDVNNPEVFLVADEGVHKHTHVGVSENYIVWPRYCTGGQGCIMAMNLSDADRGVFRVSSPDKKRDARFPDADANSVIWVEAQFDEPPYTKYVIKHAVLSGSSASQSHTIAEKAWSEFPPPHISGDLIVWDSGRFDLGVHGANIRDPNAPVHFEIGRDIDCGMFAWYPQISGKWAAWYSNKRLYADNLFDPYPPVMVMGVERSWWGGRYAEAYAIADNLVVWIDDRHGSTEIYGYNLATHREFRITDNLSYEDSPAIYANKETGDFTVVWVDAREGWFSGIFGMVLDGPLVARTPLWDQ